MNKKLTTLILTVLLLLIGKSQAATLTQVLGDNYIYVEVDSGQQITLCFNNNANYTFTKWTVESANLTIDTTNPTISFTMPNSDVTIRGNYAEEVASSNLLSDIATVGAYVTYVPSSTSYTVPKSVSGYEIDKTYNPSSTTSWRVFSNDGGNVEIISTDSAGTLMLTGIKGYVNAVQTLNDMSAAYVNNEYALSGRSLGYSEDGLTDIENYKVINTTTYPLEYEVISKFPYTDEQYIADETVWTNQGDMETSIYVFLASRYVVTYTDSVSYFYVRHMKPNGESGGESLHGAHSDSSIGTSNISHGVRPVVTLKSGITVTGSGTQADPYIINESNPSQYTVTYCANGGYGEMIPQSVGQGNSLTLTTNTYEHHSKAFLGWSTSATATTATYTNGQSITPTVDMTLYAVWGGIKCSCGGCVEIVDNAGEYCSDCYTESCSSCGEFFCYVHGDFCYECYNCSTCWEHCLYCGACNWGGVCDTCNRCSSCGGGFCSDCYSCSDHYNNHCIGCGICDYTDLVCDTCHRCESCSGYEICYGCYNCSNCCTCGGDDYNYCSCCGYSNCTVCTTVESCAWTGECTHRCTGGHTCSNCGELEVGCESRTCPGCKYEN